ncbi:MAG: site-specific integrase [Bacteroidales bacterium]|nr:site-specific integrase [Bacteroidales bacterium]
MANVGMSILFLLKKSRKNRNGELPVYMRVTVAGQVFEKSLSLYVRSSDWDQKTSTFKGNYQLAMEINEQIQAERTKVYKAKRQLEEEEIPLTIQSLKARYENQEHVKKFLLKEFDKHNEEMEAIIGKGATEATVKRYKTVRKLLNEFLNKVIHRDDILLNEIKPDFIRNFEVYLKSKRNCNHNTTVKYIRNFQKIINRAIAFGYLKTDPFRQIKFKLTEVQTTYLSNDELNLLLTKRFDFDRLEQIRDVFLFCCFTGLSFSDAKSLCTYHLFSDKGGSIYIQKKRQKTNISFTVPILTVAKKIMDKYAYHPCRLRNNMILPVISNQKYNGYLKEIADICGIKKHLTTHVARHTFATTVAINNEIPEHIVAHILGHTNTQMTKHYAKLNIQTIAKALNVIEAKYVYQEG